MKVLWVIENDKNSANFKIAIKIAQIMSNKHKLECAIYGGCLDDNYIELEPFFSNIYRIGASSSKKFCSRLWQSSSRNYKIRYLLKNPYRILEFLEFKISKCKLNCRHKLQKILKKNNFDVVIGVVFPYDIALMIGDLDSKLVKIIIQLDPYTGNKILKDKIDVRISNEKKVLKNLDFLFTTQIIKQEIVGLYGCYDNNIIPIEFPEMSLYCKRTYSSNNRNDNTIRFLYAGTFYKDIRNPKVLVDLFEPLPLNYELILAGMNCDMIDEFSKNISNRIIKHGLVSQSEVEKLKNDVDVLICFNNLVDNQVPSKLFECIETGKPFINLCQLNNCPTLPYVKGYSNALTIFANNINYAEIQNFVEEHKGTIVSHSEILKRFYKHTYEYVENQIEEVINSVRI